MKEINKALKYSLYVFKFIFFIILYNILYLACYIIWREFREEVKYRPNEVISELEQDLLKT